MTRKAISGTEKKNYLRIGLLYFCHKWYVVQDNQLETYLTKIILYKKNYELFRISITIILSPTARFIKIYEELHTLGFFI
jgi:hypothetical protein